LRQASFRRQQLELLRDLRRMVGQYADLSLATLRNPLLWVRPTGLIACGHLAGAALQELDHLGAVLLHRAALSIFAALPFGLGVAPLLRYSHRALGSRVAGPLDTASITPLPRLMALTNARRCLIGTGAMGRVKLSSTAVASASGCFLPLSSTLLITLTASLSFEQTHSVLDGPQREEISEGWANDGIGELDRGERPGTHLAGRVDHDERNAMVRAARMSSGNLSYVASITIGWLVPRRSCHRRALASGSTSMIL
jgi:hypothetical protein